MAQQDGGAGTDAPPRDALPPSAAYARLVRRFGVGARELHDAFERIKKGAGLPPNARTLVDAEGNVYVERTGEGIGNLLDEL